MFDVSNSYAPAADNWLPCVPCGWFPDLHGKHISTHQAHGRRSQAFRDHVYNRQYYGPVLYMLSVRTLVASEANVCRNKVRTCTQKPLILEATGNLHFLRYRLVATGLYLFFMGLTLFLAFYQGDIPLRIMWLVFSIFCQFLALVWYTLSYIPFAREIMLSICQQTCCKNICPTQVRLRISRLISTFSAFCCCAHSPFSKLANSFLSFLIVTAARRILGPIIKYDDSIGHVGWYFGGR